MMLDAYLALRRKEIDKSLDRYLPSGKGGPKSLYEAMRYSIFSGGKRIRPLLTLEACAACGGARHTAMPIACAVEMVHTYSLIHDDLPAMDDDDYRRGKPSCHRKFGEATAILAGDALLTHAFGLIAKKAPEKTGLEAITILSDAIGADGMVAGQALDLAHQDKKKAKGLLDLINLLKTAKLFEASAQLGAIAADATQTKKKAIVRYGYYFGIAFQLVDDIIDQEGHVHRSGDRAALRRAHAANARAKEAIALFGSRAKNLSDISDLIVQRVT